MSSRIKYRLWELDPGDEFECAGYHNNRHGTLIACDDEGGCSATVALPALTKKGRKRAKPALREEWSCGSMVYKVPKKGKYSLKGEKDGA